MKPTLVKDLENLQALERELKKSGATVVYHDDSSFTAYKNGKAFKFVRVRDAK